MLFNTILSVRYGIKNMQKMEEKQVFESPLPSGILVELKMVVGAYQVVKYCQTGVDISAFLCGVNKKARRRIKSAEVGREKKKKKKFGVCSVFEGSKSDKNLKRDEGRYIRWTVAPSHLLKTQLVSRLFFPLYRLSSNGYCSDAAKDVPTRPRARLFFYLLSIPIYLPTYSPSWLVGHRVHTSV